MYDRIAVAVDGSDESLRAARRGLRLARTFESDVTAVAVVDRAALRLSVSAAERTRLRDRAASALAAVEDVAADLGQPVTTDLLEGRPAVRIGEHVAERGVDLLVVGRQGRTGLGRRLLGGVTEQLLHRSDVPVLVVPDGGDEGSDEAVSRVLLTTDGSENAAAAYPHGTAVAGRFDASLHVLNVVDVQAAGGAFNAGGLERDFLERLDARGREAVDDAARAVEAAAPELQVVTAVERTSSFAGVAAGVRAYVEANDVDLVVMGSHGRSNLRRQLLGSVAATVLRTVDVPVLVVKRPD
jgi:nucleotide-binding universal stress UspA family protein